MQKRQSAYSSYSLCAFKYSISEIQPHFYLWGGKKTKVKWQLRTAPEEISIWKDARPAQEARGIENHETNLPNPRSEFQDAVKTLTPTTLSQTHDQSDSHSGILWSYAIEVTKLCLVIFTVLKHDH